LQIPDLINGVSVILRTAAQRASRKRLITKKNCMICRTTLALGAMALGCVSDPLRLTLRQQLGRRAPSSALGGCEGLSSSYQLK
jgi:hypothetical protein